MEIFPLFADEFDLLACDEIMSSTPEIAGQLISWCNYFLADEFTEDHQFENKVVLAELFNKCPVQPLINWIQSIRKKGSENIPTEFLSYLIEVETPFVQKLEEETANIELSVDYLIHEKLFWENLSKESVWKILETNQILFSSETLFTKSLFRLVKVWLKDFEQIWGSMFQEKEMPKAQIDSSQSSGTPKKRKLDTSTYTTRVSSPKATVDVYSSKVSNLNMLIN